MTQMGHEYRFPRPGASGRYRCNKPTLAGTRVAGRDAPEADVSPQVACEAAGAQIKSAQPLHQVTGFDDRLGATCDSPAGRLSGRCFWRFR
jgi:hypothetical protein